MKKTLFVMAVLILGTGVVKADSDEPTGGVDPDGVAKKIAVMSEMKAQISREEEKLRHSNCRQRMSEGLKMLGWEDVHSEYCDNLRDEIQDLKMKLTALKMELTALFMKEFSNLRMELRTVQEFAKAVELRTELDNLQSEIQKNGLDTNMFLNARRFDEVRNVLAARFEISASPSGIRTANSPRRWPVQPIAKPPQN